MAAMTSAALFGGRPLRDAYGELVWSRPGIFRRELQLEAGSELLAQLSWPKWYSFRAVAESADGSWIIGQVRRTSFLGDYGVRDAASGTPVATFRQSWRGSGLVRFASGAEYRWRRLGFWRPRYFWATEDPKPLITYRSLMGFRGSYEMTVDPAARGLPDLPVLVLLGAYVMALMSARSHAS